MNSVRYRRDSTTVTLEHVTATRESIRGDDGGRSIAIDPRVAPDIQVRRADVPVTFMMAFLLTAFTVPPTAFGTWALITCAQNCGGG